MGLRIKPKSKIRALQSRIYSWGSVKAVMRDETLVIPWDKITEILVIPHDTDPEYHLHFTCAKDMHSVICFYTSEVINFSEFDSYLNAHPIKTREGRFSYISEHMAEYVGPYFKYGAITTKYVIGVMALTFMFFQFKYFGSLLIEKYQFLIKASCNQQCAQELWSISMFWFYFVLACFSPIVPFLFYKKIYSTVLKSKNVQVINSTLIESTLLAAIGLILFVSSSPKLWDSTSKYSNVIISYTNNSLETKLSQKVEMASKRKFEGDIEENPYLDIFREE